MNSNASVVFTSTGPQAVLNSHTHGTHLPTVAISDSAGDLLFYHDLTDIRRADNSSIPGGSGLNGTAWNLGSMIIPHDANGTRFSVVRTRNHGSPDLDRRIYHDEVDLSANGGQGAVIFSNRILRDSMTACIAATPKASGIGYWLITHEWGSDAWLVFSVGPNGLDTVPIVSHAGEPHWATNGPSSHGTLKVSPNGAQLALVKTRYSNSDRRVELYTFDAHTGLITDPVRLVDDEYWYGIEYSPNSEVLYATIFPMSLNQVTRLFQFNVSSGDSATIVNSMVEIDVLTGLVGSVGAFGEMGLAPDGKIYVTRGLTDHMGVIHHPDTLGLGCGFEQDGLTLGFLSSALLPKLIKFPNEFTVGVPTPGAPPQARLHPNPFHTTARLHLPRAPHGPVLLHCHDARGRLLRTERHGPLRVIDLQRGDLPTGLVLLSASDEHGTLARLKVVVE